MWPIYAQSDLILFACCFNLFDEGTHHPKESKMDEELIKDMYYRLIKQNSSNLQEHDEATFI